MKNSDGELREKLAKALILHRSMDDTIPPTGYDFEIADHSLLPVITAHYADREALGPCGKHPRMFWNEPKHNRNCYDDAGPAHGVSRICSCVGSCTLCDREAALAEAVREECAQLLDRAADAVRGGDDSAAAHYEHLAMDIRKLSTTGALERWEARGRLEEAKLLRELVSRNVWANVPYITDALTQRIAALEAACQKS